MRYVPNYTFLNIEEANSIILNHGTEFEDFYDLDTNKLESDVNKTYTNYRADFIVVSKSKFGSTYEYILEIRNSLWDGGYSFITLPSGVSNPNVVQTPNNPNILRITGENLTNFVIRLHLTNYADDRVININTLVIKGLSEVTNIFYNTNIVPITVLTADDMPVNGASVTVTMNNQTSVPVLTNASGEAEIIFPAANPGTYTAVVTATKQDVGTVKRTVIVKRTKPDLEFTIDNTKPFIKGAIQTVDITFDTTQIESSKLEGLQVTVKYAGQTSISNIENGKAPFYLNLRKYYNDTVDITVTITESNFNSILNKTVRLNCEYYYATDYLTLESECERDLGADLIRLRSGTSYDYTSDGSNMITINRDITIQGQKSTTGWCTLNGAGNGFFVVRENAKLTVQGIRFFKCNPAIYQDKKSNVLIEACLFVECENEKHGFMGSCVYTDTTTESQTNKLLFYTIVKNSSFLNNRGSCFSHGGQLDIDNCQFKKDNMDAMYQPEPHIVNQMYGDCAIRNSKILVDTGDTISSKNQSFSKIVFMAGKTAAVNGKTGSQMENDNSTNLFNSPYNNQSYIYIKYWYPFDINANIVASPLKGKEFASAGHAVNGVNWAYKDNLQLTRVSAGTDNKTKGLKIDISSSGGWY